MWKIGDLVTRKSYGKDICFHIVEVEPDKSVATLKGIEVRLMADAPLSDLERVTENELRHYRESYTREENDCLRLIRMRRLVEEEKRMMRSDVKFRASHDFFEKPGRVLHVDGDVNYLDKCLMFYEELRIPAVGHHVNEARMAEVLPHFLEEYQPDILILTGHDGLLRKGQDLGNLYNYRNTEKFIKAVKAARKYERSFDDLIIFAGACQSHYESLLDAGANFASSPHRILIHALDPVFIAEKIAYTPINQTVNIFDVVKSTITGTDGLGGLETRGKYRIGLPRSPY
ncbi:sporulation peptidase YabG [Tumebacillus sp. DT12]|uniref:Sporulation peptidase YabG n=1 Tax=Tumebacillus lacus TaxID=2995335 RepID=A0ABT3X4Y9_9BACL|nr:sporulation peptidase YabG [Tumebacillus lacus]MCX7571968.1 sporulation peptidase YabG [Tumebacillus lacus]